MDEIALINFAPLIQLWAGICLLFFYEPLLTKFPLTKLQEEKQTLITDFLGKYQAYLTNEQLAEGYKMLKSTWDIFYKTIKNLAALGFYYAIIILAYIGIENHPMYRDYYQALQILNSCIILYTLLTWICYKTKFFVKYMNALVVIIILMIIFHFYHPINDFFTSKIGTLGCFLSKSETSIFTLFTCILGLAVTLIHILILSVQIYYTKSKIKKIDINAESLNAVLIGSKNMDEIKNGPKTKSLNYLAMNGFPQTAMEYQTKLSNFVRNEIQEEFNSFIFHWYTPSLKMIRSFLSLIKSLI